MFLSGGAAVAAAALGPSPAHAALSFGGAVRFSWEALQSWAEAVARLPYQPPVPSNRDLIQRIDYDAHQQIRYRSDQSVWPSNDAYPVELFHVGRYFMEPVRVFLVQDGASREVLYNDRLFSYGNAGFARALSEDTGFAGLRIMRAKGEPDWLSFLGASYFRAPGETGQYGLSARGLAIDTGLPEPEEFPRFSNFWIEHLDGDDGMMVYAMLDSPSVAGAYRIRAARKTGVITDVDMVVHAREDVRRLGVAPLTSMYWYGKTNRHAGTDWRPEIHDSDGLAIWTGAGEHIWRPLNNPPEVKLSSFFDTSPKGFGLLQRERDFDAYQDDNVFYNRRPSVWVEPLGDWGEGAVQLLEIPTDDETKDNIVAFWNPKEPFRRGGRVELGYRLHWRDGAPVQQGLARVMATRCGEGGIPGTEKRIGVRKYVVDFEGGELGKLENRDGVKLQVSANRGGFDAVSAYRIVDTKRWRGIFDYTPIAGETADLRAYLELGGQPISESWVFQHNELRKAG
jgi:glucans biosynthesis protein